MRQRGGLRWGGAGGAECGQSIDTYLSMASSSGRYMTPSVRWALSIETKACFRLPFISSAAFCTPNRPDLI